VGTRERLALVRSVRHCSDRVRVGVPLVRRVDQRVRQVELVLKVSRMKRHAEEQLPGLVAEPVTDERGLELVEEARREVERSRRAETPRWFDHWEDGASREHRGNLEDQEAEQRDRW